jgi:hypothetical protein
MIRSLTMPSVRPVVATLLLACLGAPPPLTAADSEGPSIHMDEDLLIAGLANSHGDLYFRRTAQLSLEAGRNDQAMRQLKRAAHFADKPSQALVAEILWNGSHGQPQDRPAAYAWMDLAAERGYPELLRLREAYWAALSPAEQAQALAVGRKLYERYGDDVSRPRLARQLRRQANKVAGSNTGFAGGVTILALSPGGSGVRRAAASTGMEGDNFAPVVTIAGSRFYAPHYWKPELYFQHQDRNWRVGVSEQPIGSTEVGPLTPVKR